MERYAASPVIDIESHAEDFDSPPFAEYQFRKWWMRIRLPWWLWGYIASEVLRVMLLGILTVSLLYSAIAAYQIVRGGIQLTYIWPFLTKSIAYPLYFSIPLSLLFGVTLAIGRMVSEHEISAMRYHTASHIQILTPLIFLGILSAMASYWAVGWFVPDLRYDRNNLQQYVIKQLENLGSGRNRTLMLPGNGGSLLVGAHEGTDLWKVEIDLNRKLQSRFVPDIRGQLPQKLPETVTMLAQMGRLEIAEDHAGVIIHLRGVEILVPEKTGHGNNFYQRFSVTKTLSIPISFDRKERGIKELVHPELAAEIRRLSELAEESPDDEVLGRDLSRARSEWHRRSAFWLSSITFPLIGAGLCFLLQRRQRLWPFLAGNMVVVAIFYPLLMVGSSLGERGFAPWFSLALPNLALVLLATLLLLRVNRQ